MPRNNVVGLLPPLTRACIMQDYLNIRGRTRRLLSVLCSLIQNEQYLILLQTGRHKWCLTVDFYLYRINV